MPPQAPQDSFNVPLSLSTLCEGNLEGEFQRLVPELVAALNDDKDKGSITITVNFQRIKETSSLMSTSYKIKPTFPPLGRTGMCRIEAGNKLATIAAKVRQLSLLDKQREKGTGTESNG